MVESRNNSWDAELYEARHGFVWQLGRGILEWLAPLPGERILDLGCGPGQLTAEIAASGAHVVGLDSSPDMIAQARQNYPKIKFVLENAATMNFSAEFDAIFSNAALHWMLDAGAVAEALDRALVSGGRLVAELGGKGNIHSIEQALAKVLPLYYGNQVPAARTFFPSIAEYSTILETAGLEVRKAELFNRPTLLEGNDGLKNWLHQFSSYYFEQLPSVDREKCIDEVVELARPSLFRDGRWWADYRRLRILAVK